MKIDMDDYFEEVNNFEEFKDIFNSAEYIIGVNKTDKSHYLIYTKFGDIVFDICSTLDGNSGSMSCTPVYGYPEESWKFLEENMNWFYASSLADAYTILSDNCENAVL